MERNFCHVEVEVENELKGTNSNCVTAYGCHITICCDIFFFCCVSGHVCFPINSSDGNISRDPGSVVFPID